MPLCTNRDCPMCTRSRLLDNVDFASIEKKIVDAYRGFQKDNEFLFFGDSFLRDLVHRTKEKDKEEPVTWYEFNRISSVDYGKDSGTTYGFYVYDEKANFNYDEYYRKKNDLHALNYGLTKEDQMNYLFESCATNDHVNCPGKSTAHNCNCYHHVLENRIKNLERDLVDAKPKRIKTKKITDPNFIWTSSDGRENYIPDMATPHLVNTINWIERTVKEILGKPVKTKEVNEVRAGGIVNEIRRNRLSGAIDRLRNRMNAVIEDDFEDHELLWFNAAYPQYPILRDEALKRKCRLDSNGNWVF